MGAMLSTTAVRDAMRDGPRQKGDLFPPRRCDVDDLICAMERWSVSAAQGWPLTAEADMQRETGSAVVIHGEGRPKRRMHDTMTT